MKKTLYIISLVVLGFLVSCNRKAEFTTIPFVYFQNASLSVPEDAGTIEIPVFAAANAEFAVTFESVDGEKKDAATGTMVPNGKAGVDYNVIENDAAILRFKPGEEKQIVKVEIKDFPGVLTGNKDFTLRLLTAGNEVSLGGISSCKVTIIDNDHPLKSIFGEYTATDKDGVSWTMTFAADPDNYYNVFIDGIVPTFAGSYVGKGLRHYVVAPVSEDLSTINVPLGYKLADKYNEHDILIYGYDGSHLYGSGSASFAKTGDGYKLDGDKGFVAVYNDGGYYLAASDAMVLAPITLVKK